MLSVAAPGMDWGDFASKMMMLTPKKHLDVANSVGCSHSISKLLHSVALVYYTGPL